MGKRDRNATHELIIDADEQNDGNQERRGHGGSKVVGRLYGESNYNPEIKGSRERIRHSKQASTIKETPITYPTKSHNLTIPTGKEIVNILPHPVKELPRFTYRVINELRQITSQEMLNRGRSIKCEASYRVSDEVEVFGELGSCFVEDCVDGVLDGYAS
jgi:hypothetical protein